MRFCKIFLDFFASIKYRTISGCTKHILMQTSLTPLALCPQCAEGAFQLIHPKQCLLVDLCLLQPKPTLLSTQHSHSLLLTRSDALCLSAAAVLAPNSSLLYDLTVVQCTYSAVSAQQTLASLTLGLQCLHSVESPGANVALQARQLCLTLANFMMPPAAKDGVETMMLRVWSPVDQ